MSTRCTVFNGVYVVGSFSVIYSVIYKSTNVMYTVPVYLINNDYVMECLGNLAIYRSVVGAWLGKGRDKDEARLCKVAAILI